MIYLSFYLAKKKNWQLIIAVNHLGNCCSTTWTEKMATEQTTEWLSLTVKLTQSINCINLEQLKSLTTILAVCNKNQVINRKNRQILSWSTELN